MNTIDHHGGSALSGKDPGRIDRTAAYAARHAAKNVVAAGLARECEVQLSYTLGLARPVSIEVDSFGTGTVPDEEIAQRVRRGFDFRQPLAAAVKVFEGSAGEAAAAFPRHFNVAISLSLAGVGFDRTRVEIWADPDIPGAIHNVEVEADEVVLSLTSRNRPSDSNPKTSRIIAPSVLAALRSMVAPLHVGS